MMDVVIPCTCPGTPHETDTVTLRERLDFARARAARSAALIKTRGESVPITFLSALLAEQYVVYGIESWTRVDAAGETVPVDFGTVKAFIAEHDAAADKISTAADGLYAEAVIAPLALTVETSSPPTPTDASMSPTTDSETALTEPPVSETSSTTLPTLLRPFSITSTPMGVTAMTSASPAGDSSSSQNSASAA